MQFETETEEVASDSTTPEDATLNLTLESAIPEVDDESESIEQEESGLETLELRIKQHSKNALELAQWLVKQEEVVWVNYPGLESSAYKKLADKYLPNGQSGLVTFGAKGGYEAAKTIEFKMASK